MSTAGQVRALRTLLRLDLGGVAELAGLASPTMQQMEASGGIIRGNADCLVKLSPAGVEVIADGTCGSSGPGVRLPSSTLPSSTLASSAS